MFYGLLLKWCMVVWDALSGLCDMRKNQISSKHFHSSSCICSGISQFHSHTSNSSVKSSTNDSKNVKNRMMQRQRNGNVSNWKFVEKNYKYPGADYNRIEWSHIFRTNSTKTTILISICRRGYSKYFLSNLESYMYAERKRDHHNSQTRLTLRYRIIIMFCKHYITLRRWKKKCSWYVKNRAQRTNGWVLKV